MKYHLNGLRDLVHELGADKGIATPFDGLPGHANAHNARNAIDIVSATPAGDNSNVLDVLSDVLEFDFGQDGTQAEPTLEADLGDLAYARPSHAGGGKSKDDNGKAHGKNKDTTDGGSTNDDTGSGDGGTSTGDTGTDGGDSGTSTGDGGTTGDSGGTGSGSDYVSADFVSGLDTPDGYNISVSFSGSWTTEMMNQLVIAAETISDLITSDIADSSTSLGMVDDIHITATITTIDGSGGYGGWGGYSSIGTSGLPSTGYLRLDSADVGSLLNGGIFDDFVMHEMLHAMGFGTLWSSLGLVSTINDQLRFTGANAIEAYNETYATIAANDPDSWLGVPVEMDGGSGTAGVHWDDRTFGKELMTGRLNWDNVTSDMTVAALEDMGYETVYGDDLAIV